MFKTKKRFAITFVLVVALAFPGYAFSLTNSDNNVDGEAPAHASGASASSTALGDSIPMIMFDEVQDLPEQKSGVYPAAEPMAFTASIIRASTNQGFVNTDMPVGRVNTDAAIKVSGGTASEVTWSSSNPSAFTVSKTSPSQAAIQGISEGFGRLIVDVTSVENDSDHDEANVSIYTPITPNAAGSLNAKTHVYRGAHTMSTDRGEIQAGQSLRVYGKCGTWYLCNFYDSTIFDDVANGNSTYGWVPIDKVDIPVTGIRLDKTESTLLTAGSQSKTTINIAEIAPCGTGIPSLHRRNLRIGIHQIPKSRQ